MAGAASIGSRRLRILLVGVALLLLVVRASLPVLARLAIERQGSQTLGVPVRVANVDLGLLGGAVRIDGLAVGREQTAPAEEATPPDESAEEPAIVDLGPEPGLLRWRSVRADLEWLALLQGTLHLASLEIEGPRLLLERRADGRIAAPLPETVPDGDPDATGGEPQPAASGTRGAGSETDEAKSETDDAESETDSAESETDNAESETDNGSGGWSVRLDTLRLRDAGIVVADAAHASLRYLELAFEELRLADLRIGADGAVDLGGVDLIDPRVRARRELVTGTGGGPPPDAEPPEEADAPGPDYRVERVAIEDARFTWLAAERPLELHVAFEARDVSTRPGERISFALRVDVEQAAIEVEGGVALQPLTLDLHVVARKLALPALVAAADPRLAPWLTSGVLSADLDVAGRLAEGLRVKGALDVDALRFADPEAGDVSVAWERLALELEELALAPASGAAPHELRLAALTLDTPQIRWTQPATALDALTAAPGAGTSPAPAPEQAPEAAQEPTPEPVAEPAPPPRVEIARLGVTGGSIDFVDRSVSPAFETSLRELVLSAEGVAWPGGTADRLKLTAVAPDDASVSIEGSYRTDRGDVRLVVDELALMPLDPYARSTAGYAIDEGRATIETELERRGGRHRAETRLVLDQLRVTPHGDTSWFEDTFGVSLDLTLALLRDAFGRIGLDFALEVEEGEARTSLAEILVGAVRQALVGAVAAPLKLAGGAVGGVAGTASKLLGSDGGLRIDPVPMRPGRTEVAAGEGERLAGIASLLDLRPALRVAVKGRTGKRDAPVLAARILWERLEAGGELPDVASSGALRILQRRRIRGALEERAAGGAGALDAQDEHVLDEMVATVDVPRKRMRMLAEERARALRDLLVARFGVAPERIRALEGRVEGRPAVVVELAAE